MKQPATLTNALLWATAILAAATVGAPTVFSLILLPSLGFASMLASRQARRVKPCAA